ncbi:hypothetical protein AUJ68_00675 [Candidatus Woesearchaeota archaeon CG1_02_57_44]|nr:MAG: hypothetical protein AUJ68_00675 [Candidatus Woesearchaeota archaeon CG1_02_57_44]
MGLLSRAQEIRSSQEQTSAPAPAVTKAKIPHARAKARSGVTSEKRPALAKDKKRQANRPERAQKKSKAKNVQPTPTRSSKKQQPAAIANTHQVIREHFEQRISRQEHPRVEEPHISIIGTRIRAHRPHGTLKHAQAGNTNFSLLKQEIESAMKEHHSQEVPKDTDRAASGIPGLDGVMGKGFLRDSVNLIAGGPGSGKTIFAMQFLQQGACNGEPGVYISFEQTEEEILADMDAFGWDLPGLIRKKKLSILSYTPEQVEQVMKSGGGIVRDVIASIGARLVVIDSITAFNLLHDHELAQRKACIGLFRLLKKWDCTSLVIAEAEEDPDRPNNKVETFEVDAVIFLYNIRKADIRERALEIFKMRGSKHSAKIFPMTISEHGVLIYPDQTVF